MFAYGTEHIGYSDRGRLGYSAGRSLGLTALAARRGGEQLEIYPEELLHEGSDPPANRAAGKRA